MVYTSRHEITTSGQGDVQDVTAALAEAVELSKMRAGVVTVFVAGSTAAVTTIEYEPGAVADFNRLLERLAPRRADYDHHQRWGDDNGSSHVRAALLGPSLSVPFVDGRLTLGTWQQVVVLELDTRGRTRKIVFQVVGQ